MDELDDKNLPQGDTGQDHDDGGDHSPMAPEDKARAMGWVPQEEFKGDPNKWRPADQYVKNAEQRLPVANAEIERLAKRVMMQDKAISQMADWRRKAEEDGFKRGREDVLKEMREAASNADTDAFDEAKRKLEDLDKKRPQEEVQKPKVDPYIDEWLQDNTWVGALPMSRKNVFGAYVDEFVAQGYSVKEALEESKKEYRRVYSDGPAGRQAPTRVEGGRNDYRPAAKREAGWDDLEDDQKAIGMEFIKSKVFKDKAEYAKDYFKIYGKK